MTAASVWSLKRARGFRIIRAALRLASVAVVGVLAGCTLQGGNASHTASSATVVVTPLPTATAAGGSASVWVLTPVGLNLRASPAASSERLAILARGAQLDVLGSQSSGGQTWLHVRGHSGGGTDGWVLDDATLVIHRAVNLHFESSGGWSILFPAEWQLKATATPTEFTGAGQLLQVWWGSDPKALPAPPGSPGKDTHDEGPIDVDGKTTFLTVYQLDAGGYEYDDLVRVSDNPVRVFEFRFRDSGTAGDTSLFKQLLAGVVFA
jgi:hypothetical protein